MSSATARPGTEILPGYTVVDLLGHGRRVDTYDVHSNLRQCRCVVKILRSDRATDPRAREAVLREGMLLRHLTHPHLLRGYEVISEPLPAMVLETLPGATLEALLEEAPLNPMDAAHLALQLGSALHYLHLGRWLHLDVKPANIVVNDGRAILIDLSLVGRPGRGRAGAGTDGYLAPEQVTGEDLGTATDVWGLAVTLIQALTASEPVGATVRSTRFWHVEPVRRARRTLGQAKHLPRAARCLLLACLDPDPAARPGIAELRNTFTATLTDAGQPPPILVPNDEATPG